MPPEAEGGGVEPPRSCDPAVFETAYRARGSPSVSGPDRSRTCTSPGKSRELSVELRSQDVVGRARTCDAPRFRRALYQLSFDHMSRRGWTRTSSFLFVRQALSAIELLAQGGGDARCAEVGQWLRPAAVAAASGVFAVIRRREAMCHRENSAPGQGIEPRSPRSERGVLPVRRSRIVPLRPAPPREVDAKAPRLSNGARHLVPSLLCPCHSPTLRPWIAGRVRARPRDDVIVEGLWSPSLVRAVRNSQAKAHANVRAQFQHRTQERSFSLRRGLDSF